MSVRRDKKRKFWFVDINLELPNGQRQPRVRKVSPVQTRRGAEQYERSLIESILNGTFRKEEKVQPTFTEFSEQYFSLHVLVSCKKSGHVNIRSMLDLHLIPALGSIRLDQIDEHVIALFKAKQVAAGLKPATVNNHLILLRAILGKAADWNLLARLPKVKKLPNLLKPIRFLSADEISRLEAAAASEPEWQTAIVVALNTGVRLGELIALQWDDVDLVAGIMTVHRSDWQGEIGTPKSGKHRTIPLNSKVVSALKAHRHLKGAWVFCRPNGDRNSNGNFAIALRRIRKRAGLIGFEWHGLRHTFASHLAMRNIPMRAIQELLGHADMQMTLRYSHLSPATCRLAVNALLGKEPEADLRQHSGNEATDTVTTEKETALISSIRAGTSFGSGGRI